MSAEERIGRIVEQSRAAGASKRAIVHGGKTLEYVLRSAVLPPSPWSRRELEEGLGVLLPDDVVALWGTSSGLRLFEDVTHGQWGLIVWGPSEVVPRGRVEVGGREEDFRQGDLVVGEFLGDLDFVVLRCDPKAKDFGSVLIALEMDPREDWPCVGASLSEFIEKFLSSDGAKYWEPT